MAIKTVIGDITQQRVDVIVNAANGQGIMGAGVAGAIARAGGLTLTTDARKVVERTRPKGGYLAGEIYVSSPGDLGVNNVRWIYHAVTMVQPGSRATYKAVTNSLARCLRRAVLNGESIAIPALGTGIGRLSVCAVADIMVDLAKPYQNSIDIVFVGDQEFVDAINRALKETKEE